DRAGDVVACCGVVVPSVEDDRVDGAVQLAIAATAEAVPLRLGAARGDRGEAGEAGEAGFGAKPAVVGPGDDQLGGDDRPDSGLVEQGRGERADVSEDLAFELGRFAGCREDTAGEAAQYEPDGELVRCWSR